MTTLSASEAKKAWRAAKKATQEAREAALTAKRILHEAECHHKKMYDTERQAWKAMKDAEWREQHEAQLAEALTHLATKRDRIY